MKVGGLEQGALEPGTPRTDADPAPLRVRREFCIAPHLAARRLDQALSELIPELSRRRLQQWIEAGQVLVDGAARRARDKVWTGERVCVDARVEIQDACVPQAMALDLIYEDAAIIVINKPVGLVVHPAAGHRDGTLQNALLAHAPSLATVPRAGIVHRLDKDTSGLLVVAKTLEAHCSLVEQLRAHQVHREYRALVIGEVVSGGRIDAPIGRHPTHRTRMAVVAGGRPAVTHYRVLRRFAGYSLLGVELETGRTHQIRVHLSHRQFPLVGDPVYGGRPRPAKGLDPLQLAALQGFPRQALHALRLGLVHPVQRLPMSWEAPMPADMAALLSLLEAADRR